MVNVRPKVSIILFNLQPCHKGKGEHPPQPEEEDEEQSFDVGVFCATRYVGWVFLVGPKRSTTK